MKLAHRVTAHLTALALGGLMLTLAGCSPQATPDTAATATAPDQPYEAVAAQGKGFTVGALMSAHAVYVLFDPQCPHCSRLWEASLPLHSKVKFVWIPVTLMNAKSGPQGAALLGAANPAQQMNEHEKSLLSGGGGIGASASIPADLEQALKNNTLLFNRLKAESVPYILAKDLRTGATVTHNGAMDTAALAKLLGLSAP